MNGPKIFWQEYSGAPVCTPLGLTPAYPYGQFIAEKIVLKHGTTGLAVTCLLFFGNGASKGAYTTIHGPTATALLRQSWGQVYSVDIKPFG